MTRAELLEQLHRAILTGVLCVDQLNSGKLDLVERVEVREQMTAAWVEIRRLLGELDSRECQNRAAV